jgi:hypothetical protein
MVKANKTKTIRKVDFTWEWNPHLGVLNENKELLCACVVLAMN